VSPVAHRGRLSRLQARADFLRLAAAAGKAATPGLVLQAAAQPGPSRGEGRIGIGVTASRKIGGAVVRNRAKRRLRALAREVLPHAGRPGTDYVLIARAGIGKRPFRALVADLEGALARVHARLPAAGASAVEEE
jgi:ribonuclease P protein component